MSESSEAHKQVNLLNLEKSIFFIKKFIEQRQLNALYLFKIYYCAETYYILKNFGVDADFDFPLELNWCAICKNKYNIAEGALFEVYDSTQKRLFSFLKSKNEYFSKINEIEEKKKAIFQLLFILANSNIHLSLKNQIHKIFSCNNLSEQDFFFLLQELQEQVLARENKIVHLKNEILQMQQFFFSLFNYKVYNIKNPFLIQSKLLLTSNSKIFETFFID